MRTPSKAEGLAALKARGLEIDAVVDIGVFEDTPELRLAFPDRFHLLVEPLAHPVSTIERNYAGIDHRLVTAASSDKRSEGHLKLERHNGGGGAVTHSRLLLMAPHPDAAGEYQTIPILRVDQAVKEAGLTGRLLLKIDVDGHEMREMWGLVCEAGIRPGPLWPGLRLTLRKTGLRIGPVRYSAGRRRYALGSSNSRYPGRYSHTRRHHIRYS